MTTAAKLTRDMDDLGQALAELRKDDPGDGELNPDPVDPGLEDGIQDPFDYRDLNEGHMPREGKRDKKDDDDPGTQDVDPPNQADVDDAPLDVIVPQEELGKYSPDQLRADDGRFGATTWGFITPNGKHIDGGERTGEYGNHDDLASGKGLGSASHAIHNGYIRQYSMYGEHGFEYIDRPGADKQILNHLRGMDKDDKVFIDSASGADSPRPFSGTVLQARLYLNSRINKLDVIVKTISGSSPISLNAKGVTLANRLAERIAAKGCLDIMYSSTLPRGVETVQPILKACPHCLYAEATGDLVPWKLGAYEGREPKDVSAQITALVENPDEVPPGEGADGEPGESFNAAKARQLGFFKRVMQDWRDDPTLKIGVQVHSRGEDLFIAWVADGAPDDYDVDAEDVIDPDDQPHASVMRWAGKDRVKEVDLDSDDMLKGGVYLVLHSLTDDDGDDGNPELEKYDPGQPRDDKGEFGAGVKLGVLQDMHDRLKDHAGRSPNPSHAAEESFQHGVTMLGDKARELAAHPAFNVKINRSGDKARGVVLNHVKLGDNMRRSATESDKAWYTDLALSHFHDALLTMSRVLGSKWVGKSAGVHVVKRVYLPPIEVHRAAKSAWEAGMSVVGITEALAGSRGLDLAHVQAVADFFAAPESATASPTARNAYGGVNAVKWAAKVIAKSAKIWEPWVGVDLDGTLAEKLETYGGVRIGAPIKAMVAKVKAMLAADDSVRVFTARVAHDPDGKQERAIKAWCREHVGQELPVTNEKDPGMTRLIDDLAEPLAKAGSGVMIAFMLDEATAEKLKVDGGEDPKDMHVTLAYLGKPDALDMSKLPALERAIRAYAAQHAPVAGTIDGPVRFGAKPQTEGRDVAVAAFCNPGIQEFRAGLVAAIKAVGVDVPRPFDYRPHVCLKYIPTGAPMPVQRIEPMPVTFDAVTLCVGGKRTSYPLSGDVVKYSPDQPRDDHGRWGSGQDNEALANEFPLAGAKADGLTVLSHVDNTDSIESSLEDFTIVPGIREVKFSDFPNHVPSPGKTTGYDARDNQRVKDLAAKIQDSGEISPLIVVVDHESPYILEGAHRFDALDYMGHKSFPAMVVVDNDAIARHAVTKYSPDQPRAADGEWGGRPKASARVERARKSCVLIRAAEQRAADRTEQKLSDALGVPRTADNSAFDLRNDDVGIEVKTLLVGAHEKITMNKTALARKVAEQRDDDLRGYTVVADMRGGRERAAYYYKEGFGSFRLGSMTKVSLSELKGIIR